MKISTGIGLRLSPEPAVLSPLSLPGSLVADELLSCRPCMMNFCEVGLGGVAALCSFKFNDGRLMDGLTLPTFLLGDWEELRLKRSFQDEGDKGAWRESTKEDNVEDDQRERKTRGGSSDAYIPTKGLSGIAGETGSSQSNPLT